MRESDTLVTTLGVVAVAHWVSGFGGLASLLLGWPWRRLTRVVFSVLGAGRFARRSGTVLEASSGLTIWSGSPRWPRCPRPASVAGGPRCRAQSAVPSLLGTYILTAGVAGRPAPAHAVGPITPAESPCTQWRPHCDHITGSCSEQPVICGIRQSHRPITGSRAAGPDLASMPGATAGFVCIVGPRWSPTKQVSTGRQSITL